MKRVKIIITMSSKEATAVTFHKMLLLSMYLNLALVELAGLRRRVSSGYLLCQYVFVGTVKLV
jgi:hypothetical protein